MSPALAAEGLKVTVVTPAYGFLHIDHPLKKSYAVEFPFCGRVERAEIHELKPDRAERNVTHVVVENIWIRGNPIYFHDDASRPFAADASKFALFCSAVGQAVAGGIGPFKGVDILHAHDWHAGTLLFLRELHPAFAKLKKHRAVLTIHNIGIQGTRPIEGHESSLGAWFPELLTDPATRSEIAARFADRRFGWPCYTPLAAAIQTADMVNTVSPTYAEEIVFPSDHGAGFWGAEGLSGLSAPRATKAGSWAC
ncbi:MAG: glycogen/starch synthase [Deltaproteobacteria bacterium]|nr:glycogen/starch synthase [Deltaproteobacteria bacterium]